MQKDQENRKSAADYFKKNPSQSVYTLFENLDTQDYFVGSYIKTDAKKIYYLKSQVSVGDGASVYLATDEKNDKYWGLLKIYPSATTIVALLFNAIFMV